MAQSVDQRLRATAQRAAIAVILVTLFSIALLEAWLVFDLRSFEYKYLYRLIGFKGLFFIGILHVGLIYLAWRLYMLRRKVDTPKVTRFEWSMYSLTVILLIWMANWIFLENPLSRKLLAVMKTDVDRSELVQRIIHDRQISDDINALYPESNSVDVEKLSIYLARARLFAPDVYEAYPMGGTVAKYSKIYGVSPELLLSFLHHNSFDGEAVSGPMPFFAGLNGESFRDLVQAHLPWWFVESRLRVGLAESDILERLFGTGFGWRLRYALHKANYDVSVGAFNTDTYSDFFLVLREHEGEFPELFGEGRTPLDAALGDSFDTLRDVVLLEPYYDPYSHERMSGDYYDQYRQSLITFTRATYYKLHFDFEFSTKVQALFARHYYDSYAETLGQEIWDNISEEQRWSFVVMMHDMYRPNVGQVGYNVYLNPELILAAFPFVVTEARSDAEHLTSDPKIWRPEEYLHLWGAATMKLRMFSEMWETTRGEHLNGFPGQDVVKESLDVVQDHM